MAKTTITLDERELAHRIVFTIQVKKSKRFHFGLWLIKLGCWISNVRELRIQDTK